MRIWNATRVDHDTARLEAFSDGVFAIAVTLLVLEVRITPDPGQSLATAIRHSGATIGAYAASFLIIGIMWANHHTMLKLVRSADQLLLLWNLLLLMVISFVPVPTALIAEHTSGPDGRTAFLFYGGVLVLVALGFNLVWRYAVARDLLVPGVSPRYLRSVHVRYLFGPVSYVAITLVALVSPVLSLVGHLALAVFYLVGPSPYAPFDREAGADTDQEAGPTA